MRRVVITGFGIVSPIGTGKVAFFEGLENGRNGIAPITRFDASGLDVRYAGEVRDAIVVFDDEYDRELAQRDPKVGFALTAAAEALAMAGVESFSGTELIHIGTSLETFFFRDFCFSLPQCLGEDVPLRREVVMYPWCLPLDTALVRIRKHYGNPAQAATNCSACAVGVQTIGQAFHAVRGGRCDLALAGGFDSMLNPLGVGGFQLLGAPATGEPKNGEVFCRPFDASRRGLVLGEGAGFVVLEERRRALAAGKTLFAEVLGFASTLDAHGLSAPDPEGEGAARSMQIALEDAGLPPQAVDHINTHGTGTQLNDPAEAKAIRRVFAQTWERVPVAAVKSMTGHSIAAAGAIEIIACLYTLLRGMIPPNIGLDKVGAGCELKHVGKRAEAFAAQCVLTNSFGFGGQNASLILTRGDV
ncbi:MAG: beta-ketoacyl-[acyl-carrier-protein] synthase family protein [Clostridiales Family XIII bacterium]|jgi:3-oxoacyl-[acyl-carrier-protein] synthase II|nr:beta-ketoacyl-[acyl-carrier-protein] synthase family protein [Clostridiales Family XIII bacterium]